MPTTYSKTCIHKHAITPVLWQVFSPGAGNCKDDHKLMTHGY